MKILQNDLFYKIKSIFRKYICKERTFWEEILSWSWNLRVGALIYDKGEDGTKKLHLKETGKDMQILMREN